MGHTMLLDARFFQNNRKRLAKLAGGGLVVLTANGLVQRSGDTVYPFRQDSSFFYLTGLKEPDFILVMDGEEEFLVLPKRSFAEDIFGGAINCDEIAKISGIKTILENKEGWAKLKELQQNRKTVHTIAAPPRRVVHTDAFSTNPNRRYLEERLKRAQPATKFVDIRSQLTVMRQIKQPEEITAIKKAIAITGEGLAAVRKQITAGVRGYELKAELDRIFAKNGVEHAFAPIVTSGPDTAVMHSLNYARKIQGDEPVLFDIGAEVECYSADVSRTFFPGKLSKPNDRFQAVYNAVNAVKQEAEGLVKSGLSWRDLAVQVDGVMGEKLIALGLIQKNERKEVRRYFSHALGHSLGLDTHDVCDYTQPIKENMVITIEPGIYIPEEGFGVRIEDDYVVTKTGVKNLSAAILLS